MENVHTKHKYKYFKIENYTINTSDGNTIEYSIFAEISFAYDCIEKERYSVWLHDWYGHDEVELYSGTLSECRKEIKRLIESYWNDEKFEEVIVTE